QRERDVQPGHYCVCGGRGHAGRGARGGPAGRAGCGAERAHCAGRHVGAHQPVVPGRAGDDVLPV
ncbi:hypothetical protein H4S01_007027, partial [Coemansia sp. RSA 2610]